MTIDASFWKQHTRLQVGSLVGLLIAGLAQVIMLHLLLAHTAPTNLSLMVRGVSLIVLPFLATFFASRLGAYAINFLQLTLLENLSQASTNDIEQVHAHTFSKVITQDVDHIYQFWREFFSNAGFNLPVLLYLAVFMLIRVQFVYIAGVALLLVILAGMAYLINRRVRMKHRHHHQAYLALQDRIQNYIGNVFQFRLYRSEGDYVKTVRHDLTQFSQLTAKLSQNRHLFSTYISSVLLLLLWGGLWFVQNDGAISPPELAVITLVFLEIRRIGTELFFAMYSYQRAQESASRLSQWLTKPVAEQPTAPTLLPVLPIRIENLVFRYKNSGQTIQYPNLTVEVGEKVWFKGPNGRGKSTLWKILTGLYTDSTTIVWLNNNPMQSTGRVPFWKHIGAVTEPARCYSGTLWGIIGNFSVSREEVVTWLSARRLLALFDTYPQQLDTQYDSVVNNISAGQLKWLLLMQAFFLQPDILVLDEPLSSLDTHHQSITLRLIEELPPTTTLIVISHQDIAIPFNKTILL